MDFFKSDPQKTPEEEFAAKILEQSNPLGFTLTVLNKLPSGLTDWLGGIIKAGGASKSHTAIDLCTSFDLGIGAITGDLIIKKNRDPRPGDIIEIGIRTADGYTTDYVKVLKINITAGTFLLCGVLDPTRKGSAPVTSFISVIDRVIKYEEPEWKKTVEFLKIQSNVDELESWLERSIDFVQKNKIYDRDNVLKQLQERLKLVKKK